MPLLLHIIDGYHAAVLITFQDDQRGGNFLAGLGENTGIVPGVLCDGALDTQARHHGVSRPVGVNPAMANVRGKRGHFMFNSSERKSGLVQKRGSRLLPR